MRIPRPILAVWYLPPMALVLILGAISGFLADLAAWLDEQFRSTWEHLDRNFTRRWRR